MLKAKLFDGLLLVLWTLLIGFLAYQINGKLIGIDDADIFFVYSKNLALGKGLLFSEGIPRVEGYTSTLWMLLCSAIFFVGFEKGGIFALTLFIFFLTHLLGFKTIERLTFSPKSYFWKILYIVILTSSCGYCSWTTVTLMDTTLWGALLISMNYFLLFDPENKKEWLLAILTFCLAPLARPEALLICPLLLVIILFKNGPYYFFKKPSIFIPTGFLFSAISVTAFRIRYFGYPFPNTFYAKVSHSLFQNLKSGGKYFLDYLFSNSLMSLSFLLAIWCGLAFCLSKNNRKQKHLGEQPLGLVSLMVLSALSLPIFSGGDHFNLYRFYQPIYPIIAIQIVLLICKAVPSLNSVSVLNRAVGLIWLLCLSTRDNWLEISRRGSPIKYEFFLSELGRGVGNSLNELFSKQQSDLPAVGVIAAGGVAMTYRGTIYDLMGLNNSYISHFSEVRTGPKNHAAFQKEAFFNLPIDILLIPTSPDDEFIQEALKGLLEDPVFKSTWTYGSIHLLDQPSKNQRAFYRRSFVDKLNNYGEYSFEVIHTTNLSS